MSKSLEEEIYIKGSLNVETLSINFTNNPLVKRCLKKMAAKNEDNLLEVCVRPFRYRRSDAQNRYYWGVCVPKVMVFLKEAKGHRFSRDEVHQLNLQYIVGAAYEELEIKDPFSGELIKVLKEVGKSTSKMNTLEFTNFIEELRGFWLHAGCDIPEPEKEKQNSNFLEDLEIAQNITDD
jgi:hypothetical protein|tara:strand:- start:1119 stop:1655 length:537 start_codon:yes stop_codon:yes gene_type:complete